MSCALLLAMLIAGVLSLCAGGQADEPVADRPDSGAPSREYSPHLCHEYLLRNAPREMRFDPRRDFEAWKVKLGAKLRELVGPTPEVVPLDLQIEFDKQHPDFREIRFVFTSERHSQVPCHLLIPTAAKTPAPVVICLQGHSTGMHISLGRPIYEGDQKSIDGGRDFGLQAVAQGYAALVMEQRAFGERKDARFPGAEARKCLHPTMVAALLGRTMVAERVWDVSRAIDALALFPEIDTKRIGCMGNSGGGTTTWYAACLEPRISVAMPSCSVCTYEDSIGKIDHCPDNYIPGALRYFDMPDLAGLIAPRALVVVAGKDDGIFPIAGVKKSMKTIEAVYKAAGSPNKCRLVVGDKGHQFYPDEAWPVLREVSGWGNGATSD